MHFSDWISDVRSSDLARRGAKLMVSVAGDGDLRKRLAHLLSFWSAQSLEELFEDTRAQLLTQHPLLGERRIQRVAQCLSGHRFQEVFKTSVRADRKSVV